MNTNLTRRAFLGSAVVAAGAALSACGNADAPDDETATEDTSATTEVVEEPVDEETVWKSVGNPELPELLAEVEPKFSQEEYVDGETGLTLPYNLFLPDGYDEDVRYPLVVFITDSSVVGRETTAALEQGFGGVIWAWSAEQEKHPCIVAVPEFPETILDDHSGYTQTDWVTLVPRFVQAVASQYAVDAARIYATGQSMGGMTFLHTAAQETALFAAEFFVSCQWDISTLVGLESQRFFYVVAGGDDRASGGQAEVLAMFDADGVPYAQAMGWDAQWSDEEFDAAVADLLAQGADANFAQFEVGTVLAGDNGGGAMMGGEHMASFDYAYRIEAIRDWLFRQSRS